MAPYYNMVGAKPTIKVMLDCVSVKKMRPLFHSDWLKHPVSVGLVLWCLIIFFMCLIIYVFNYICVIIYVFNYIFKKMRPLFHSDWLKHPVSVGLVLWCLI